MRIVVHCGQPKTGTTTLQVSLWSARGALRAHGVCYPDAVVGPRHTHKAITPLFIAPERISPHVLYDGLRRRSDDEVATEARRVWNRIVREVRRRSPEVVVLSAETYGSLRTPEEAQRLRDLLADLTDDVDMCLYLRNPADRYLSSLRQRAKARGEFVGPTGANVRSFLESVEGAFGRPAILRVYDRPTLVGQDVVADFLAGPLAGRVPLAAVPVITQNDSLSTEAALLLLAFRRDAVPDAVGRNVVEARALKSVVTEIDRRVPRLRPDALRPEIRSAILRSSTDLDWVRQRYGVEVPGVSYPVDDGDDVPVDLGAYTRIQDVCEVDPERLEVLTSLTIGWLVEAGLRRRAFRSVGVDTLWSRVLPRRTRTWLKSYVAVGVR